METKRKLEELERKRQEDEDRKAALDLQVSEWNRQDSWIILSIFCWLYFF